MAAQARAITVLYDGSEASGRALDAAAGLAGYGSTLTVLGMRAGNPGAAAASDGNLQRGARERLRQRQVPATFHNVHGTLADALRGLQTDLLVVGRDTPAAEGAALEDAPADVLLVR